MIQGKPHPIPSSFLLPPHSPFFSCSCSWLLFLFRSCSSPLSRPPAITINIATPSRHTSLLPPIGSGVEMPGRGGPHHFRQRGEAPRIVPLHPAGEQRQCSRGLAWPHLPLDENQYRCPCRCRQPHRYWFNCQWQCQWQLSVAMSVSV